MYYIPMTQSNTSAWQDTVSKEYPSLQKDISVDVAVIGAGITGITTAYELAKRGKKVVLLDKGDVCMGETAYTTAFVTAYIDTSLGELEKRFGLPNVKLVWESGKEAISRIEQNVRELSIDCEFVRCPACIYTIDQTDMLKKEAQIAEHIGAEIQYAEGSPLGIPAQGYLLVNSQAKFHPLKYLNGLLDAFEKLGGLVCEQTDVQEIKESGNHVLVTTPNAVVTAEHAVVATYIPISAQGILDTVKLISYQSYVVEFLSAESKIGEGILWDTDDPYHYIRVDKVGDSFRTIVGGEDHRTGDSHTNEDHFGRLREYSQSIGIETDMLARTWSGQIAETIDGLPYIGLQNGRKRTWVASGFAGNGMTYGTISGTIISDLITVGENIYAQLYSPKRFKVTPELASYGVHSAKQLLKGKLSRGTDGDIDAIPVNTGEIVNLNGKKVAVYRDADGTITKLVPVCTHLGCDVQWNANEKTWDCPCHGSRFGATGEVLKGPARKPLERAE